MVLEIFTHGVEDFDEERIAQRIEDLVALPAGDDEVIVPEDGKMLGEVRGFDVHMLENRADGELARAQSLDDMDAGGMGEDLEDLGLEAAEVVEMFGIELGWIRGSALQCSYVYSNIRKYAS